MQQIHKRMRESGINVGENETEEVLEMLNYKHVRDVPTKLHPQKQQAKKSILRGQLMNNTYNPKTMGEHASYKSQAAQIAAIERKINNRNGRTPTTQEEDKIDELDTPGIVKYMSFGRIVARDANIFKTTTEEGLLEDELELKDNELKKLNTMMLATTIRLQQINTEYTSQFFIANHNAETMAWALAHVSLDIQEKRMKTEDENEKREMGEEEKSLKAAQALISEQFNCDTRWLTSRIRQHKNEIIRLHNEQYKHVANETGGKIFRANLKKKSTQRAYSEILMSDSGLTDEVILMSNDTGESEEAREKKMQAATNSNMCALMGKLGHEMDDDSVLQNLLGSYNGIEGFPLSF